MDKPRMMDSYITLLSNKSQFMSQVNYGDGEFACLFGEKGKNCDGVSYSPELSKKLRHVLFHPTIKFYGYNPGSNKDKARKWLLMHEINVPEIWGSALEKNGGEGRRVTVPWVNKEIILKANYEGMWGSFIHLLRSRRVMVVGGPHLKELDLFDHEYIETPAVDAWDVWEEIVERILKRIQEVHPHIILFASGLATKPIIWELVSKKVAAHLLDIGANLDPYVGVFSRTGHSRPGFKELMNFSIE